MYLTQLGVVKGDQNGSLHTDRVCTFQGGHGHGRAPGARRLRPL